jgi:hypothetical protein
MEELRWRLGLLGFWRPGGLQNEPWGRPEEASEWESLGLSSSWLYSSDSEKSQAPCWEVVLCTADLIAHGLCVSESIYLLKCICAHPNHCDCFEVIFTRMQIDHRPARGEVGQSDILSPCPVRATSLWRSL